MIKIEEKQQPYDKQADKWSRIFRNYNDIPVRNIDLLMCLHVYRMYRIHSRKKVVLNKISAGHVISYGTRIAITTGSLCNCSHTLGIQLCFLSSTIVLLCHMTLVESISN